MNRPNEFENESSKSIPGDAGYTGDATLIFDGATVSGLAVCAIGGPKLPPWQGE